MPSSRSPSPIVEAIDAFFAEHDVASLRLPSGWFGRPHDNMHQLSKVALEGDHVLVILDGKQVLLLDAVGASQVGRVLSITIRSGRWDWVEYGGNDEHIEALGQETSSFTPCGAADIARSWADPRELIAADECVPMRALVSARVGPSRSPWR